MIAQKQRLKEILWTIWFDDKMRPSIVLLYILLLILPLIYIDWWLNDELTNTYNYFYFMKRNNNLEIKLHNMKTIKLKTKRICHFVKYVPKSIAKLYDWNLPPPEKHELELNYIVEWQKT